MHKSYIKRREINATERDREDKFDPRKIAKQGDRDGEKGRRETGGPTVLTLMDAYKGTVYKGTVYG